MHKAGKMEKVKPLYERHYQISSLLMVDCLTTIMTGILELFHTELLRDDISLQYTSSVIISGLSDGVARGGLPQRKLTLTVPVSWT